MSSAKRARTQNYNLEDTLKLVDAAKAFKNILENKRSDAVTSRDKQRAWEAISSSYNAQTTANRTAEQLRQKYDSLKKEARKYAAKKRQHRLQTGGGPADTVKPNIIFDKILELIKLSSEGHESYFDSDATFMTEEINPIADEASTSEVLADCVVSVIDAEDPVSFELQANHEELGSTEVVWNKYTPQMLRAPLHPALEVNKHLAAGYGEAETYLAQEKNPSADISGASCEEDGSQTPSTSNNRTRTQLLNPNRHTPVLKQKKSCLSLSGRKLEPWIETKTEIARDLQNYQKKKQEEEERNEKELHELRKKEMELKLEYLRRKYEEEQRREEELHNLRKREIELSINIKEKTLQKM